MARLLLPDDFLQVSPQFLVGRARATTGAEVVLGHAEQSGANFAVRGQTQAVTMTTERFAYRGDDPNLAAAVGPTPTLGRLGLILRGDGAQGIARLQALQDLATGHHQFFEPSPSRVQRHELDKAQA